VPAESILARLVGLPVASNRLQRYLADGGYVVLDDTFNSNPSGARIGLARLRQEAPGGQRVVVTPGMVELGPLQYELNADFGEAAARIASTLIFVARTNRQALEAGAARANGQVEVITVERLDTALAWVRQHLQPSDAVLYENDLPDHFP
ncbi:MAG: glutamate ligase domain-containing protein, partial [Acidimicrobiales bacterium]